MGATGTGLSRPRGETSNSVDQAPAEETEPNSAHGEQTAARESRPYPPSWVDRVTDRVRRLQLPWWLFYLVLGVGLSLAYMVMLLSSDAWTRGLFSLSTVVIYSLLNGMTIPYILALIHFLDDSAESALARFRPVMTVDDTGYEKLHYQLTTLPARSTLIAGGFGAVYAFAVLITNILTMGGLTNSDVGAPVVVVLISIWNLLTYIMVGVLVYHTLHQLRTVNLIYTKHTRINLFHLGPLYDLSGLTARTAVGIGIPTYVWFQVNSLSLMGTTAYDIIQTVFLGAVMLVTFISPLWGAHRLLEREKQRLLDEVAQRIEATIATLHSRVDNHALEYVTTLKDALEGLVTEQNVIHKLRTWPWRTETINGLALAFLIPIIIWIVQRVLERLGL